MATHRSACILRADDHSEDGSRARACATWGRDAPLFDPLASRADGEPDDRRLRLGHGLPRHDLRRAGRLPDAAARRCGPTGWARARRHRQPRGRRPAARAAHLPRGGVQRRRLRRLLLGDPGGAGAHRPQPLPPLRRLAQPGHRLDGRRPRPQHGHATGTRRPCGRPSSSGRRRGRAPCMVDLGDGRGLSARRSPRGSMARDGRRPRLRRRGLGPHGRWPRHVLDQLARVRRLPAQRRRGDGLHRARRPPPRPCTRSRTWCPLAVVTNGADGALAIDATHRGGGGGARRCASRRSTRPAPATSSAPRSCSSARSPTGRCSSAWRSPALCSSLSVQQFGGSLAAPGWGDIADWWARQRAGMSAGSYQRSLLRRYAFLDDLVPDVPLGVGRRASATIARHADVAGT